MAGTVREFAIKITADTKELQTGTDKAIKRVEKLTVKLRKLFGGVDKEIQKASRAVNQGISNALRETSAAADQATREITRSTRERTDAVRRGISDEERARRDGERQALRGSRERAREELRIQREAQRSIQQVRTNAAKQAAALERQASQTRVREVQRGLKELERTASQFGELDVVRINTTQPINQVQELGRVLKTSNRTTMEEIRTQLKSLDSQRLGDINSGEQRLIQILNRTQGEQIQAAQRAARARVRLGSTTAAERIRIERDLQRQILEIQRQGAARQQSIRQTASRRREEAPNERRTGRVGRGGSIISELGAGAGGAAGQLGPLAGVLGKLGPLGIAAGAGLGILVAGFKKAFQASKEFEDGAIRIKTLLDDTQADKLDGSLAMLRETSKTTGESIVNLETSLFNVISAVPALANNIDAAAAITDKASKTATGLGASTDEVALAATNLGNAMGLSLEDSENVDFIMDTLANTMKQGVIPNASLLAANIAKVAPSMAFLFDNTKDATKAIGSMTAVLTANGVKVDEAQSKMKALVGELSKGATQEKLFKAGIEGINKETGKIEDIRKVFSSMGKDVGKFTSLFSSQEAIQAIQIFTKEGGQAFSDMQTSFDMAGGTANQMFETMAQSSENASKRLDATWNDLFITLGEGSTSIVTDIMDTTSSAIEFVNDLFKSAATEAAEAQGAFDQAVTASTVIGDSVRGVSEEIVSLRAAGIESGVQVDQAIMSIGNTANQFKDTFPLIAQDIQNIINAPGDKTVATLGVLNAKMREAQELAQAEVFLTNFESAEAGMASVKASIDEAIPSAFDFGSIIEGFTSFGVRTLIDGFDELGNKASETDVLGNLNAGIKETQDSLSVLKAERDSLDQRDIANKERLREIGLEIKDGISAQNTARAAIWQTETDITAEIQRQITNAQQLAEQHQVEFNLKDELANIQFSLVEGTEAEGELLQFINETVAEKGLLKAQEIGDTELTIELQTESLEAEIGILKAKEATADILGLLSDEQQDLLDTQIESLEAQIDALSITEDHVDATDDLVDSQDDSVSLSEDAVDLLAAQVDLTDEQAALKDVVSEITSEILENEGLTTDEKVQQLADEEETRNLKAEELGIEIERLALLFSQAQAQAINNDLSAEAQATALATAEGIRLQIMLLKEEAAIASSAAAAIGASSAGFQTKQRVRGVVGGGGGSRRRSGGGRSGGKDREADKAAKEAAKAEKDRQKAAEKAAKDAAKAQEKAAKDLQKRQADAQKASEKLEKERQKRAENASKELLKAEEARIDAETSARLARIDDAVAMKKHAEELEDAQKKIREGVLKFSNELAKKASLQIGEALGGLEQILKPFRSEVEAIFRNLAQVALAGEEVIENILVAIAKKEEEIALKGAEVSGGERDISALRAERDKITVDVESPSGVKFVQTMTQVETAIAVTKKQLGELEQLVADTANTQSTYNDRLKDARKRFSAAQSAMNSLNGQIAALGEETDENRNQLSQLNVELAGVTSQFLQADTEVKKLSAGVEGAGANVGLLNKRITDGKILLARLTAAEKILAKETEVATNEINSQEDALKPLRNQITSLTLEIDGLNKQIEEVGTGGLTTAQAQASAKQFQGVAQAFVEVGTQLKKVVELQDQAFAASDPTEVVSKFDEAQKVLDNLTSDFELFGITIDGLSTNLAELKKKDIAGILEKAFIGEGPNGGLTAAQEREKKRLEILLTQTIDLIELQTTMVNNTIEFNESLEETVEITSRLEEKQKGYASAITQANSFIEQNKITEQISEIDLLAKNWAIITAQLEKQTAIATQIIEKNKTIIEQTQVQIAGLQSNINLKRMEVGQLTEELAEAKELGLTASIASLSEELATAKQFLDLYTESEDNLTARVDESNRAIEEQIEKIDNLNGEQKKLNATKKKSEPIAIGKDQAKADAKASQAAQDRIADIQKMTGGLQNLATLGEEVTNSMFELQGLISSGDAGGAVLAGAALMTKLGQALLNSKNPVLAEIGAVLLVVGIIGTVLGKLEQAINGEMKTAVDFATERLNKTKLQNDALREQLGLMEKLADIGDKSVDTARERLDILKEDRAAFIEANKFAVEDKTQAETLIDKKAAEDNLAYLTDLALRLENAKNASNRTQQGLVDEVNTLRSPSLSDFDFGSNITSTNIESLLEPISSAVIDAQSDLDAFEILTEFDEKIFDEELNLIGERVESADFRIQIATALEDPRKLLDALAEKTDALAFGFGGAFAKATGMALDLDNMDLETAEELGGFIDDLFQDGEIPADVRDSYNEWVDTIRSAEEVEASFVESLLEESTTMLDLIEARERAGKITAEESETQRLEQLEAQRKIILEQIDALGLSIELEIMLLNIEERILAIKEKENEEDSEANRLLTEAVRNRQKLIEIARSQQGGAPLSVDQQRQIDQSEDVIVAQLKATGMSQQDIAEFLSTLPAFEAGGMVPVTGPAILHKGELVIPADMVANFDDQILQMSTIAAQKIPIVAGTDDLTKEFSRIILEREAFQINNSLTVQSTIGDIIINVPTGISDTQGLASEIKSQLESSLIGAVQSGINENKLDFRGKRN